MFVQLIMQRIAAERVTRSPYDRSDTRASLLTTWQLSDLVVDPKTGHSTARYAAQGSSLRGAPGAGEWIGHGEERELFDPFVRFGVPELTTAKKSLRFGFDVHWWPVDSHAEQLRAHYSNANLRKVSAALSVTGNPEGSGSITGLLGRGPAPRFELPALHRLGQVDWRPVKSDPSVLFGVVAEQVLQSFGLEPLATHRFLLEIRLDGSQIVWRTVGPTGAKPWKTGEGTQKVEASVQTPDLELDCLYRCRVLE